MYNYDRDEYRVKEDLKKCNNCDALDLSGSDDMVPDNVYNFKQLEYLNLANKNLDMLNSRVCELSNLKYLFLDSNDGIQLPECLYDMNNLKILSLSSCNMKELPQGLNKLTNLKILTILGNRFDEKRLEELRESLPNTKIIAYLD
ncbi:hypothetical protein GCM10027429_20170 [Marivirga atlantica]|jgi:Leucine-rich repeat (LRR) protein